MVERRRNMTAKRRQIAQERQSAAELFVRWRLPPMIPPPPWEERAADLHPAREGTGAVAYLDGYFIRVRRHPDSESAVRQWYATTERAARKHGLTPLLLWQARSGDWRVMLPMAALADGLPVDGEDYAAVLTWPGFVELVRDRAGRAGPS